MLIINHCLCENVHYICLIAASVSLHSNSQMGFYFWTLEIETCYHDRIQFKEPVDILFD